MTREPVIRAPFSETALATLSPSTSSLTNERRAGLSNAVATPPTEASAYSAPTGG